MVRKPVFVGIDVGTTGVRVVCTDETGMVLAKASRTLRSTRQPADSIHEQDPECWWSAVCMATREMNDILSRLDQTTDIQGIAVTSTSGTLLCTDSAGNPLRPAILYDDGRAASVVELLNGAGGKTRWSASTSLAKAVWIRENEPRIWEQTKRLLHPTDWLTGKLCGVFGFADSTSALKLGYECESGRWSHAVSSVDIPSGLLPAVVKPGNVLGNLSTAGAAATGLPSEAFVVAGATDGMTGLIASGAHEPREANTTLGTTIVWKVISDRRPLESDGIYVHLHPAGYWVPGAASNTGPGSIAVRDTGSSMEELDGHAASFLPTKLICYPLVGKGERFPFVDAHATAFVEGEPVNATESHAAQLQALGFVERWGYEQLRNNGVEVGETLFSTGAAARSRVLSQTRADILGRTVNRCVEPSAAFGAAVLATAGNHFGSIQESIRQMTRIEESFAPRRSKTSRYEEIYGSFLEACKRRGYAA